MSLILSFAKPAKKRRASEHAHRYVADGAPPGVYVSNMSDADRHRWKAKLVVGDEPRVEVRTEAVRANMVAVVTAEGVRQSANGPVFFTPELWEAYRLAVDEAQRVLELTKDPASLKAARAAIREGHHPLEGR